MLSMLDETIGSPVDVDQLIATFGSAAVALQKAVNWTEMRTSATKS